MPDEDVDPKSQSREGYDRRKSEEIRELKTKLAELESKLTEQQWGMDDNTDPRIRSLVTQQKQMQQELEDLMKIALKSPDDEELGEYMDRVMDDHGDELKKLYPNRIKRLEAVRVMARGLRSEDGDDKTHVQTGRAKDVSLARVHLTGGGPASMRGMKDDAKDFADFQRKMKEAKSTAEREELLAKWEATHPQ